ncbi:hypothetical protein H6G13_01370 [Pseudanabaena sp. FACHB-2040]|nr:hypothetical protein [Pseudanabaena sp. FACHB-2040]
MDPQCSLLPLAISEILADAATTGQLSLADRYGLMAAILSESLSEEERAAIDRLLRAVLRGRLQISNHLSTAFPYEQAA